MDKEGGLYEAYSEFAAILPCLLLALPATSQRPSDGLVEQPTRLELVINARTVRTLSIDGPVVGPLGR